MRDIIPPKKKKPAVRYVAPEITPAARRVASSPKQTVAKKRKFDWKQAALIAIAVILVGVTGYATYGAWQANQRVRSEVPVAPTSSGGEATAVQEGTDEAEPHPSALEQYTVAADLPRAIYINKVNVGARVLPMGINELGAIQAPVNIYDAGWYTGSVKPGEAGAMFVDGHASGATRDGLFAYLDKLVVGDEIEIEKGDGARLTYRVVQTEIADLEGLDMRRILNPAEGVTRGLNLMTCIGDWVPEKNTYDQRVMVWAEQIS